ncbi:MAG: type II toxin-antitoxin system PemK/MazF family toxin [Treponema sp.]|jgi:mRNA interferase MazF|nr:type II toxin-antitoxin system PemK/MazF family toxin [Treponema sp.]
MVNDNYIPDRGDIVWLNFDPQKGHEQKGKRIYNKVDKKRNKRSNRKDKHIDK